MSHVLALFYEEGGQLKKKKKNKTRDILEQLSQHLNFSPSSTVSVSLYDLFN